MVTALTTSLAGSIIEIADRRRVLAKDGILPKDDEPYSKYETPDRLRGVCSAWNELDDFNSCSTIAHHICLCNKLCTSPFLIYIDRFIASLATVQAFYGQFLVRAREHQQFVCVKNCLVQKTTCGTNVTYPIDGTIATSLFGDSRLVII